MRKGIALYYSAPNRVKKKFVKTRVIRGEKGEDNEEREKLCATLWRKERRYM